MTRPAAGAVLSGRYRLESPLGAGATAAVWRARDLELGRGVAVKILFEEGVDPELASRFTREGQILARLDHPNIVRVLSTGTDGGTPYLVMDLLEGQSLKERIAEGSLPPAEAVAVVADVAAGLASAHRAGIVHRDVKPANILCGDDGVPRLVDFGIARASDLTTMTGADIVMGTASYLSPEQAQGKVPGPASDVYALGCVLFELLTGAPPFSGPNAVGIAYRHVHEEPPSPGIDPSLDAIVLRSLAKDPAHRYVDAGAFETALRQWSTHPIDATVASTAMAATEVMPVVDAPDPAWRPPWALVGAVAAALLLVVALAAASSNRGSPSTTTSVAPATTTTSIVTTTTAPPTTVAGPHKKHGKEE